MFIRAKVDNVGIHKVLVDGEACINIMSHFSLKKIRKRDTDLKPHNMVLSNYEGMTSKTLGVIQVEVVVGTTYIPTLFMVFPTKAKYNLLIGKEWIHGIGGSPFDNASANLHLKT